MHLPEIRYQLCIRIYIEMYVCMEETSEDMPFIQTFAAGPLHVKRTTRITFIFLYKIKLV